jgi:glyoxylase-like metal-dependent hydrolase (beta-lactamase superfamily II)
MVGGGIGAHGGGMAITPIFVNSAYVDTFAQFLHAGAGWRRLAAPVRFGFFRHPQRGAVLVDTGYCARTTAAAGRSLILRIYAAVLRPALLRKGLALEFLARQGVAAEDVRTIILTHLHADHLSALKDFPGAEIITSADSLRLLGEPGRWRHGVFDELIPDDLPARARLIEDLPEAPLPSPLPIGRDLFGDGLVQAVPLPGHMAGHFGLHFAGHSPAFVYGSDAQWLQEALRSGGAPSFPLSAVIDDRGAAQATSERLREFAQQGGDVLLCHQTERHRFDEPETV